jgi:hypothetical protein
MRRRSSDGPPFFRYWHSADMPDDRADVRFDPKRTWTPIDLAQDTASKSSLWLFVGWDVIISISPNPGGPSRTKFAPTGVALFVAEGVIGTAIGYYRPYYRYGYGYPYYSLLLWLLSRYCLWFGF